MRLLQALACQPLDRPPVWLMRQAGRHLPEYRELRNRHSFEETMTDPELATEVTLQPLRRYPLDAAIVFADIMTPIRAMGVDLRFDPGPKMTPLTLAEVAALKPPREELLEPLCETLRRVRSRLEPEKALIGFCGGPATVLAYLLEGGGSRDFPRLRLAFDDPTIEEALAVLAEAMNQYLRFQISSGADVVQVFDTWAGVLPVGVYEEHVVRPTSQVVAGVGAPSIYFAPNATHLLGRVHMVGADGYGVDWRIPVDLASDRVGPSLAIQGNLDPAYLLGEPEAARRETEWVLEEACGRPGHIFNLGHGVLPQSRPETVAAVVDTVANWKPGIYESKEGTMR